MIKLSRKVFLISIIFFSFRILANDSVDDQYVRGYISSLFKNSYNIAEESFDYKNGILTLDKNYTGGENPETFIEKITTNTKDIKEIKKIVWKNEISKPTSSKKKKRRPFLENLSMPSGHLFQPLIADPNWPRFTLAYQYYTRDKYSTHVFAPNFGASFGLLKFTEEDNSESWELGVQAGLFAIMDIGSKPTALINADYYVGLPLTYSSGSYSQMIKFYHLSSHLGDEFMLTKEGKKIKRINLSYEGIDALFSYYFGKLRVYGGGGYLVHKEPAFVKRGKVQCGLEYLSETTFLNGMLRPVSAIDFKFLESTKWSGQISIKTGIQFENHSSFSKKVQLMLEYYQGNSIHGQFFRNKVEYFGIGLHSFI